MSFFTGAEVDELRELSASAMDAEVTVRAPGTAVYDSTTGRSPVTPGAVRYSGVAAIRPINPSRTTVVGQEDRAYRQATVHLPHTAGLVRADDTVEVVTCDRNTALEGEVFRVIGVGYDTDLVSWTLTVEHVAGSRTQPE